MEKTRKTAAETTAGTTTALSRTTHHATTTSASRSERLGLRSSAAQLMVLRRAAEAAHKSLTDFILDSACLAAEQTLLDQRLFMASSQDYQTLLDLLDRPVRSNAGLKDLFSRQAPWEPSAAKLGPRVARKAIAKKPATSPLSAPAQAHARA